MIKSTRNIIIITNMKINLSIHRFKYTDHFNQNIKNFASIHRHDSCKDFKEQWMLFIQKDKILFENEIALMLQSGYKGDPYTAMYKSVRFYYRKLYINQTNHNSILDNGDDSLKNKPIRTYITFPPHFIDIVDTYIKHKIATQLESIDGDNFTSAVSPSDTLKTFCREHETDIMNAIQTIVIDIKEKNNETDFQKLNLSQKFKKMYKNRFYKIQEKLKN